MRVGEYMEQQLQDIGVFILHVIREMLVLGAAGFVIGLLLRKIVKEGSDRLINNIEFFIEDTRKNIEKLVESIDRLLERTTEFTEHTGRSGSDDMTTRGTLASGAPSMPIFVGNLAFTITEQDLRQLFEPYGVVDRINIITDHETGRQRGFGFVEMPDRTAARAAIAGLQGTELAGRVLNVDEAKPRPPSRERHQSR